MNIPAPSQQYDSYDNGYSGLRQNWANEAGSNYGMDAYGYDQAALEAYKQQLATYIQQAKAELATLQAGSPEYQQDMFYLQQAYQYAEQVGLQVQGMSGANEFDPLAASANSGYGITPSYQDSTKMIYEEALPAMTADKKNLKEEHFYAPPYDFTVPGSATANVSNEVDPNHPDKTRVCVTVTWPDGTVKKHYFYNVDWKDTGLTIRSISPDHQITLDTSSTNNTHIQTAEIGESTGNQDEETGELTSVNPEAAADSPPSILSEDGSKAVYNKEADPTITVYPDGPTNNEIHASGIFTLNAYRQSDQFTVKESGENLIISVTTTNENGEEKVITYTVKKNQIDKIIFGNIDNSQIDITGVSSEEIRAKLVDSSETQIQKTPEQSPLFVLQKLESMGVDIESFLTAYYSEIGSQADSNHDGKIDIEEFKIALKGNDFLPKDPNSPEFEKLTLILAMSDPTLKNMIEKIKTDKPGEEEFKRIGTEMTARICELLQALYEGKGINIYPSNTSGNIGQRFEINFNEQSGFALPKKLIGLLAMAYGNHNNEGNNE